MVIPLATTTISVYRNDQEADPYDRTAARAVARAIRAHISSPSGRDHIIGGHQSVINARLDADPCDLRSNDLITDEATGQQYNVVWQRERHGFGLDHVEAGLNAVEGAANG